MDKQNVVDHIRRKHSSFISVYSGTSTFCRTSTYQLLIMNQSVLVTSSSNILQAGTKSLSFFPNASGLYYATVIIHLWNVSTTMQHLAYLTLVKTTTIRFTIQKIPSIQQYATYKTAKSGALNTKMTNLMFV